MYIWVVIDGYQCEACPIYIKGLYAYNPRQWLKSIISFQD